MKSAKKRQLGLLMLFLILLPCAAVAAEPSTDLPTDISVYFTDNIPATESFASTLSIETALISLLNAASTSIDASLFSLARESVCDALVQAHERGVTVRITCERDYYASFQVLEEAGMPAVPDTRSGLMHNKFFVIDRRIVWTGSTNMTDEGFSSNHNNSPAIVCPELALAYEVEFEEMFIDRKFGTAKTDNTPHCLTCDGIIIESHFSPSDGSEARLIEEIRNADTSIYFAIYYFTSDPVREALVERASVGVTVKGVFDALGAGNAYAEDEALCDAGIPIKREDLRGILHHKFMVIDVDRTDPVVLTGSYNWTSAGTKQNDENTLIIHDQAVSQVYYDEWCHIWRGIPAARGCNMSSLFLPLALSAQAGQLGAPS